MTPAELRDHILSTPGTYSDTLKNVPSLSVRMDKSQLTVINDLFLILWMNDEKTETEKLGEDKLSLMFIIQQKDFNSSATNTLRGRWVMKCTANSGKNTI